MKSMTGFGVGEAALGHGKVVAEVRAVNHRYLDVRVRLPKELPDCGMFVEQLARTRLSRGRCEILVRIEGSALPPPTVDLERARAAFQAFSAVRDELAPGAEVPISVLAAVPDLFTQMSDAAIPRVRETVQTAVHAALDDMELMRAREGDALQTELRQRIDLLRASVDAVEARLPDVIAAYRRRIRERVRGLLGGAETSIDDARLEQEIVMFADRSDITEELTRMRIHMVAWADLLGSGEPNGRRLDFLLQEMGREINTMGSKSQDALIARAVVDAKAELERLREQVQNVE